MHYIAGKSHKQTNKVYLYNSGSKKKIHIRGEFKDYLSKNQFDYLNIAYREHSPNVIYFIPCFDAEYDSANKPVKVYFEEKNDNNASFSCSKFFDEMEIPVCESTFRNGEQKFKGFQLPYVLFNIDIDRKAIHFDLSDIMTINYHQEPNGISEEEKVEKISLMVDNAVKDLIKTIQEQID